MMANILLMRIYAPIREDQFAKEIFVQMSRAKFRQTEEGWASMILLRSSTLHVLGMVMSTISRLEPADPIRDSG